MQVSQEENSLQGVMPSYEEILSSPNLCLVYYLMSSYLYYYEGNQVFTDAQFDELCRVLVKRWKEVTHPHKHLTTLEDLKAGTGFSIKYPSRVQNAALHWFMKGSN